MINGDRVRQAREFRGLTQIELAKKIGVHQSEIVQIELGRITPGDEILQKITFQVGFPPAFFKQPTSVEFPLGSLLYRARAAITKKERSRVYQYSRIFYEVVSHLERNTRSKIQNRLPRIDDIPEDAAIQTRSAFGLSPDTPINNLVSTIEKNGVLVIALPTDINKIDAFSVWVGDEPKRPIIILTNGFAPGDRLRFSMAYELGHLVLHQAMNGDIKKVEKEANNFASEFLLPKEAMLKELDRPVNMNNIIDMKKRWRVSIQAIMMRARELEVITQRQYKYLIYQLNKYDWRTKEPIEIPIEKPRLVGQVAELKYGTPIDYRKIATHTNLPVQLIRDTIEAHAIKSTISGNNKPEGDNKVITITEKET
ncbi:XRE family transcriptional regulator [Candidatus Pacearchaeota archaeon]|jgi:Zn-dependent peptidase ImmA (M78 family)/DNA-binding XRE family transcriptional regulator|nr:XRE family transcriptional regulator [Candidatus Pacearchaeota archaeon]